MGLGAVVDSWWNEWRAVSCMTSTPLRDGEAEQIVAALKQYLK